MSDEVGETSGLLQVPIQRPADQAGRKQQIDDPGDFHVLSSKRTISFVRRRKLPPNPASAVCAGAHGGEETRRRQVLLTTRVKALKIN